MEYCGHLLDETGIHFERSKIDSILDFKTPETQQQLRAFLGLANWFRDHVNNHSRLVKPLHGMLTGYSKHKKLQWTPDLLKVYEATKKAVHECPKLFFLDDVSPIYLHTDASQYGMGAYLFQVREEGGVKREVPIRFLSKSFDDRMSRWSTIQQEGYAIFYAITSWEYLLRDRRFLVRTDHANLRLLHAESNDKVIRWMLAIQGYDFDIVHIKGTDNIIADGFSRLCSNVRAELKNKDDVMDESSPRGEITSDEVDSESVMNLMEILNSTESPSIPKLFITLMTEQFEEQLELWALPIIEYETMTDQEIQSYLHSVHNGPAGHFLVTETLTKLRNVPAIQEALEKEPNLSRGLRARCERFVRECPTCQKHTFEKVVNRAQPFTVSQYSPMDTLMIDYIERLPEDSEGYKFILVIVDCFSRFCTLHATKTTQASELARKLLVHASLFGLPCRLTSDKGSSLISNLIEDFTALVGTEHVKALAASKEEMAIVERLNREVMRHLRNIVFDRQLYDNWSLMLPFTNRILNATIHSSTGMSPAEIIFGSSISLNRGILAPLLEKEVETLRKTCTYKEYVSNMWTSQQTLIAKARANLQEKDAKHILKKNKKNDNEVTIFPIDSYVLAENPNYWLVRKEPNKLKPILKGPFRVVAISDDNAKYTVLNLTTMRLRVYHVTALRAFHARPEDTDLTKYAVRDDNFFIVKSVLGFRPTKFDKGDSRKILEFKIEWDIDNSTTWEPWSKVRKLKEVQKWVQSAACKNKALKALFPVQQVQEEMESDEEYDKEELNLDNPYWPALGHG